VLQHHADRLGGRQSDRRGSRPPAHTPSGCRPLQRAPARDRPARRSSHANSQPSLAATPHENDICRAASKTGCNPGANGGDRDGGEIGDFGSGGGCSSGGAGGAGSSSGGVAGSAGTAGSGGPGGGSGSIYGGGGGGGGYYGGGGGGYYGGGGGGSAGTGAGNSAGGGGGSSYGPSDSVFTTASVAASVAISYSVPSAQMSSGLTFTTQPQSTVSPSQTVTVSNTGGAPLDVTGVTFAGTDPGDYLVTFNGCLGPVAVGDSCSIGVSFAPRGQGTRSATLKIASNDPASPETVSLSGTGGSGRTVAATGSGLLRLGGAARAPTAPRSAPSARWGPWSP
jgi:hypothetical protein